MAGPGEYHRRAASGVDDLVGSAARALAAHRVPGATLAVLVGEGVARSDGFGLRTAGTPTPMTSTTLLMGGSFAKLITALASMRLVEWGELDLDRDVNDYLRGWKVPHNGASQAVVTLRQLLGHTSGAPGGGYAGYEPGARLPSLSDILTGRSPANSPVVRISGSPGKSFRYSGAGMTIVQLLLEDLTGRSFGELMEQLVFAPLGLRYSTFAQPLPRSLWSEAATGHDSDGVALPYRWPVHPELAAVGLWTTAGEIALVLADLQRTWTADQGVLVRRATLSEMLKRQAGGPVGLGLWPAGSGAELRLEHHGDCRGYVCHLVAYLALGIGAVVLTNGAGGAPVCTALVEAVAGAYAWPGAKEAGPSQISR